MKDKYTYEQVTKATKMMLAKERYTTAEIAEETDIIKFRIGTWKHRWKKIESNDTFHHDNLLMLKCISNLTYGVSEDVWNDWLIAIDEAMSTIAGKELSNEILEILQNIAKCINERHPKGKGVTSEMIDRALAYFVDATRQQ